ncbi:hypothetical protein TKK_0012014 [Trichogramma kaykai]|uniref:MAD2L1-binding protein n=1 Tax=Trichogramma kaykai TaxID=54128 RepID=A0ABD2WNY8_9HYME
MMKNSKRTESNISVDLDEPLTGESCSQLVMELVKYVMYQKQQIPLSCDSLMKLHKTSKSTDRNFSLMQKLVDSLANVSHQLNSQFARNECDVKEILIIIGATTFSPKLCIRIELPYSILSSRNHSSCHHSSRKILLNVMKSMLNCEEFQQEMTVPLGLTNTFVLVQKRDSRKISEYFVPKPQFNFSSQNTASFLIKLNYNGGNEFNCNCGNLIRVFNDFDQNCYDDDSENVEKCDNDISEIPYQWYQSKDILKGFKFLR